MSTPELQEPITPAEGIPPLIVELADLLNRHSRENASNTPDHILAGYLVACLDAYDAALTARGRWFGRTDTIGGQATK